MKPLLLPSMILLVAFYGCAPKSDSPAGLLPEKERAPQFDQVSEFLDLGGVFYAYMDLTNQAEELGNALNELVVGAKKDNPQIPNLPLDFQKVLEAAGINGLEAIGLSSRSMENGMFHNRSILYFPEGVTGLFAIFGSSPEPFDSVGMAPAGSDFLWEMSYQPTVLRDTILEISDALTGAFGRGFIASQLSKPMPELGNRTPNQLIESMGDRFFIIMDFDAENPVTLDRDITMPRPDVLIGIDGAFNLVQSLRSIVENQPDLDWVETDDGFEIRSSMALPPPYDFFDPLITADKLTDRILFTTRSDFLEQCLGNSNKLRGTDPFKIAANHLPPEGLALTYVSPDFVSTITDLITSAASKNPFGQDQFLSIFTTLVKPLPQSIASVTTVGPDGLYTASNLNTSHRATMANIAVQPVVFLTGMSAAMAVPAFQKVRETSKQKTIMNNLRQIASGGQQFMLEEGVAKATYSDIVPEYVRPLIPVDGEDYTTLEVTSLGDGTLSVTTDSGKTVEYTY